MKLHCDKCGRELGDYLYGPGGIEEIAYIGKIPLIGLPDIICKKCLITLNYNELNKRNEPNDKYLFKKLVGIKK